MSEHNLYINNLKHFKNKEIVLYHHLGLGDMIICNGLVNKLSNYLSKINLIVDNKFHDQAVYLYSNNQQVEIVSEKVEDVNVLDQFVETYAKNKNLKILKVGWADSGRPFYYDFYKIVKLPYRYSYKYFDYPKNYELEDNLKNHLININNVNPNDYVLVHRDASNNTYELNIEGGNLIYIDKETDIYNNIFLYSKLIKDASEIHCINSSFVHLVDRIETSGKLIYHDVRGSIIKLKKKWKIINYENKD
jgi:hypothetical protein